MGNIVRYLVFVLLLPMFVCAQQGGEAELADKYYEDAEFEPALEMYEKLHRKDGKKPHYIVRITECLSQLEKKEEAIDFLDKVIKKQPLVYEYPLIQSRVLASIGKVNEAEKIVEDITYKRLKTVEEFARIGKFIASGGRDQEAMRIYLEGRKKHRSETLFAPELAELYVVLGKRKEAVEEYLRLYFQEMMPEDEVKISILKLISPEKNEDIEEVLLAAVQKNQKDLGLRAIIYEFYVGIEDFIQAFMQVKSIDKVFKEKGDRVYQFALTMRNNKNYQLSNKALGYVIENHEKSAYFLQAFREKAINNELEAFETLPLDTTAIKNAVISYNELFETFGKKPSFYDAIYRKANLMAIYLDDLDGALEELEGLTQLPIRPNQMAEAKLLMGDVYLMKKEYTKSKLQYTEVEKAYQDEQLGALAKFKQGQLDYFKGDFELAQARLSAIKENTSNDISNDALNLNLLIQDNIGLDSTTEALKIYADAELLAFQREYDQALVILDSLMYRFPNHTLTDEILWRKANIYLQYNDLDKTFQFLDNIIDNHGKDILADDAVFLKAKIYDYNLKLPEKAMDTYMDLLIKYPGSLYSVESRKRIRQLRNG